MAENHDRLLAINPGSTSTKLAVFAGDAQILAQTLRHSQTELQPFAGQSVLAQLAFRRQAIQTTLDDHHIDAKSFDGVAGRGGLLRPLASGTYAVNEAMLADLRTAARGEHASNLGAFLAQAFADDAGCPAYIVDPVSVDEWPPVARLSGLRGLDRECLSHALNTKAVAKRFAREQGRDYAALRLIVAHLGSGISVSAHAGGRMIDVTNSREEGAFSTERAGSVPAMKLVELCFSGGHSRTEIEAMLFGQGGLYAYLGTRELTEVQAKIAMGDADAQLACAAMLYQIAKDVGAMATVLDGRVDAILLTGGMARVEAIVVDLRQRLQWIAAVHAFPGEDELLALAEGVLRVLRGEEAALVY